MLSHLNSLIEKLYSLFASSAPDYIKPKFRYLLHYPRLILQLGPLQKLWCMSFESFHQKLKKVAKQCLNFKNVALTVASRVQLGKWYEFNEGFVKMKLRPLVKKESLTHPGYVMR